MGVCTNTLCAVLGGDEIFDRLKDHLDVGNDETTEDGQVTLTLSTSSATRPATTPR